MQVLTSGAEIEMWGDGKQTRSFTFIDDCVEGILRITKSDYKEPLNLGSTEMVSMNEMMETIKTFDGKTLPIKHIPGPEGVRGRNSDNALILEKLGWEPTVSVSPNHCNWGSKSPNHRNWRSKSYLSHVTEHPVEVYAEKRRGIHSHLLPCCQRRPFLPHAALLAVS